jgi:hypothetical protein
MCMTDFADPNLSLSDGRDLYVEIVGEKGWQQNLPIFKIVWLLPDFVEDMAEVSYTE